jgi:hypothetical protein
MTTLSLPLAVTQSALGPALFVIFGPALYVLIRYGLLRSVKVDGCLQPVLWVVVGVGTVGVLMVALAVVSHDLARTGPRMTQDVWVLLGLFGFLAVCGGLLWVGRTTEGGRIVELVWLCMKYSPLALGLALLVLYILFGVHRRH